MKRENEKRFREANAVYMVDGDRLVAAEAGGAEAVRISVCGTAGWWELRLEPGDELFERVLSACEEEAISRLRASVESAKEEMRAALEAEFSGEAE